MNYFIDWTSTISAVSLIIFNILVYILLSVAIFTSILLVLDKSFSTLNKLKQLQQYYFLFVFVLLFLLSLAGVPPLLGFVGKFLLYIQLLAYKSYFLFSVFLLFMYIFVLLSYIILGSCCQAVCCHVYFRSYPAHLLFNIVVLYFYIQNIRFMVSKSTNTSPVSSLLNSSIHEDIFLFLLFVMFFNLLGICYFENFLIYLNYWISFEYSV